MDTLFLKLNRIKQVKIALNPYYSLAFNQSDLYLKCASINSHIRLELSNLFTKLPPDNLFT